MSQPEQSNSAVVSLHHESRRGLPFDIPEDGCLTGQTSPFASAFLHQSTDHLLHIAVSEAMKKRTLGEVLDSIGEAAGVGAQDVCIVHFQKTTDEEWRGNRAAFFHHHANNAFFNDMKDTMLTGAVPDRSLRLFSVVADTPAALEAASVLDVYFKLVVDLGSGRILRTKR